MGTSSKLKFSDVVGCLAAMALRGWKERFGMSLFYMDVRTLNRSAQSAVAAAAYRSGESLYSERDMETKNYRRRETEPESFILGPNNAPDWVYDREKLWNEVEKRETNINSRLAREIKVALPVELSDDVQKELLTDYVQRNFVDNGMVADISIHRDKQHNPHAHILLTVRPFDENGNWAFKKRKDYVKDDKGNKVLGKDGKAIYKTVSLTDWDRKESLLNWRKDLSETINRYYEREGYKERISHESYEKQGVDKMPKQRLSVEEYRYEKSRKEQAKSEGKTYRPKTYYAKINQEIDALNKAEELRKQKIVELDKYKKAIDTPDRKAFDEIRQINNLSHADQVALRHVAQHLHGFVDLDSAYKNVDNINHFKRNVEKKYYEAVGINDVIERAKDEYKKSPKRVLTFGLTPKMFDFEIQALKREYNQKLDEYGKTETYFDGYQRESLKVLDIQKKFVEEEFEFLYPEQNDKLNNLFHDDLNTDYAVRVKDSYVKQYRKTGELVSGIPEFSASNRKLSKEYSNMVEMQKQVKQMQGDLTVLRRTKDKRKNEYVAAINNNYNSLKVRNAAVSYLSVFNQYQDKMIESKELNKEFDQIITNIYPDQDNIAVNELPIGDKMDLININIEGKGSGDFKRDRESVNRNKDKQEGAAKNQTNAFDKEAKAKVNSVSDNATGKGIGKTIGDLVDQLTKEENEEERRKKNKKNKSKAKYRDLDEENQR